MILFSNKFVEYYKDNHGENVSIVLYRVHGLNYLEPLISIMNRYARTIKSERGTIIREFVKVY